MIPKADRDADKAILAAATPGTWIAALPSSQDGGVQLAGFGPAFAPRWPAATSLRVGGTDSNTAERYAAIAHATWQMTMGQHAANAKAAAHAVNRLPAYIAEDEEMERRVAEIAALAETRVVAYSFTELNDAYNEGFRSALKILRGET